MTKEFLNWWLNELKQYPHGRPKEIRLKWEEQPQFIKDGFEAFGNTKLAKNYKAAYDIFIMKTQKGIPEDAAFDILGLSEEDLKQVKVCFEHFMEGHRAQSRKGAEKLFGK